MLHLRTFGGLSLLRDNVLVTGAAAQRRRLALLAALASAGDAGVSRDRLLVLFWPDADDERGRHALGQALYAVRRDLDEDELIQGTTELRLDPRVIRADSREFATAIGSGDLHSAAELYAGPFLDGFHMKDAPEFERWVEEERSRLKREYVGALERLAAEADSRRDVADAVEWWKRLAAADPLSARVACGLMTAFVAAEDRSAAIQHARVHEAYVRGELGIDPDLAVHTLARRIAAGSATTNGHVDSSPTAQPNVDLGSPPYRAQDSRHAQPPNGTGPMRSPAFGRRRRAAVAVIAVLALTGIGAVAARVTRATTTDSPRNRVVVAPFENATGDSALAGLGQAAADWITHGLARTGIVDVVDAQSVRVSTRLADSAATSGAAWLSAVVENAAAETVVWGRVYRDGDSVVLRAQVSDAKSGTVLRTIGPVRGLVARPMPAIDGLGNRVVGALASVIDSRLASLTTPASPPPTFAAYRLYMEGLDSFAIRSYLPARALFFRSAATDTSFLLPLLWAMYASVNAGDATAYDSLIDVLITRRDELPPAERFGTEAFKEMRSGNRLAELEAYRRAAEASPRSQWMFMRGGKAHFLGRYAEADSAFRAIDPYRGWARGWAQYWVMYLQNLHALGRYSDEVNEARRAQREFPALSVPKGREMLALAAMGDADAVMRILDSVSAAPLDITQANTVSLFDAAIMELESHGHLAPLERVAKACASWYRRKGEAMITSFRTYALVARATCFAQSGFVDEARRDDEEAIRIGSSHPNSAVRSAAARAQAELAMLAARRRDSVEVERILALLPRAFINGNKYRGSLAADVAAAGILATLGDRARAVHYVRRVVDVEGPIDDNHRPALAPLRGYPPYEALRLKPSRATLNWKARVQAILATR